MDEKLKKAELYQWFALVLAKAEKAGIKFHSKEQAQRYLEMAAEVVGLTKAIGGGQFVPKKDFAKWFEGSKIVEGGKPKRVYHGSINFGFKEFKAGGPDKDRHALGIHFGTRAQSENFRPNKNYKGDGKFDTYEAYLNIKKPLRLVDKGSWHPNNIMDQLINNGDIEARPTKKHIKMYQEAIRVGYGTQMKAVKNIIKDLGYDGVVYKNRYEGKGRKDYKFNELDYDDTGSDDEVLHPDDREDSYIVFDDSQVHLLPKTAKKVGLIKKAYTPDEGDEGFTDDFHGWIHKNGSFSKMNCDVTHGDFIAKHYEAWDYKDSLNEAYNVDDKISLGHGGEFNAIGHKDVLNNPNHPATKTLIDKMKQHGLKSIKIAHEWFVPYDKYSLKDLMAGNKIGKHNSNDVIKAVGGGEMWGASADRIRAIGKFHGIITPDGKFHELEPDTVHWAHMNRLAKKPEYKGMKHEDVIYTARAGRALIGVGSKAAKNKKVLKTLSKLVARLPMEETHIEVQASNMVPGENMHARVPRGEIESGRWKPNFGERDDIFKSEILALGSKIGIKWSEVDFTPDDLEEGMKVEREHEDDPETKVVDNDRDVAKIAWAHLKESKDYYKKLKVMEGEMKKGEINIHHPIKIDTYNEDDLDSEHKIEEVGSIHGVVKDGVLHLHNMDVEPEHRRKGLASGALRQIIKDNDIKEIFAPEGFSTEGRLTAESTGLPVSGRFDKSEMKKGETYYRADTGYKHDPHQTALDVLNYEESLGNDTKTQALKYFSEEHYASHPAHSLMWVGTNKESIKRYGEPERVDVGNHKVIAEDGEGGKLIFKKSMADTVYVATDGDNIGASVERAALLDDLDSIISQSNKIKAGADALKEWARDRGAKIYIDGGDDVSFILPSKYVGELDELREIYNKATGFTVTIGVGDKISRAGHAMLLGKLTGKNKVVVWDESVDERLLELHKEQTPEEKQREHGLLRSQQLDEFCESIVKGEPL